MKRLAIVTVALLVLGAASGAQAAPITFDLNCTMTTSACVPHASYGTITLAESTIDQDGLLIAVHTNLQGVYAIYLNYVEAVQPPGVPSTDLFSMANGTATIVATNDGIGGFNLKTLDIAFFPTTQTVSGD